MEHEKESSVDVQRMTGQTRTTIHIIENYYNIERIIIGFRKMWDENNKLMPMHGDKLLAFDAVIVDCGQCTKCQSRIDCIGCSLLTTIMYLNILLLHSIIHSKHQLGSC